MNPQISEFGYAFLFILGGIIFVTVGLLTASLLRPHKPNPEKLTIYECGEETVGSAWGQFNSRYYIIALIFVLFEVEIVFLFPWATVFAHKSLQQATNNRWGWFALIEVLVFVGILVVGLGYVWVKGYLDWVRPTPQSTDFQSPVPMDLYEKVNKEQTQIH
jgi:NADH-quinone oxidoreductase subunit A